MDGKHPKRRKDKYNPYSISKIGDHYFLCFKDVQGISHKFEIGKTLYELFDCFELEDISYLNIWDRHIEQSELTESSMYSRAAHKSEPVENAAIRHIETKLLHSAIDKLPVIQRRRLKMYYFDELTYRQIAKKEGCTFQAVAKTIKAAEKQLKNLLET